MLDPLRPFPGGGGCVSSRDLRIRGRGKMQEGRGETRKGGRDRAKTIMDNLSGEIPNYERT